MEEITVEEFKARVAAHGHVSNVRVNEAISYYFRTGPSPATIRITDCELKDLVFGDDNRVDLLQVHGGSIGKLTLETRSTFAKVQLDNCAIAEISMVETDCENFVLHTGSVSTKLYGRDATLNNALLSGNFTTMFLERGPCSQLELKDCVAQNITFLSSHVADIKLERVNTPSLQFDCDVPPNQITIKQHAAGQISFVWDHAATSLVISGPLHSFTYQKNP